MKIYIDGEYYDKENAKISVFDHGLLYGDGVFEGIRIYSGRIFKLEHHIRRLYDSAKALGLDIPLSPDEMQQAVKETVLLNEKKDGYIRLVVTRGAGDLGINPRNCKKAAVIIIVGDISLYPERCYSEGIPIITASVRRISPQCFDPRIKSLNYLNNILAKQEALRAGCLEALMLTTDGFAAECTGDNIFIVKEGVLYTPPSYLGALEGITMETVLDLARTRDIPVERKPLTVYDFYRADECFLTGTACEIMPVVEIDQRKIGPGKPGEMTALLGADFKAYVNRA